MLCVCAVCVVDLILFNFILLLLFRSFIIIIIIFGSQNPTKQIVVCIFMLRGENDGGSHENEYEEAAIISLN